MSNFTVFNKEYIATLIKPFNFTDFQIIPIKYEAITPDIFLFLFKGTDNKEGVSRYYVAVEFDYVENLKEIEKIINNWHSKILRYIPLYNRTVDENPDIRTISAPTDYPYYAILVEAEAPKPGTSFWADNIIIKPGDNIDDKISHFTKKEQSIIHKGLDKIINHKNELEKSKEDIKADLNQNDTIVDFDISIFKNSNNGFEFFYNKDSYKNKHSDVDEICQKLEDTIKNNYADSIKDLAMLISSCLIVFDDVRDYYIQYPVLEEIDTFCEKIASLDNVSDQNKLLDKIKTDVKILRNTLRKESINKLLQDN